MTYEVTYPVSIYKSVVTDLIKIQLNVSGIDKDAAANVQIREG